MKNEIITSRLNPFIKKVFSLSSKKGRLMTGCFWIEGSKAVEAALTSNKFELTDIVINITLHADEKFADLLNLSKQKNINIRKINETCFKKISSLKHSEGIGAIAKIIDNHKLPNIKKEPVVVLWQMQHPGNQGAVIRSAAAFGCKTIISVEPSVDVYHPLCIRATSGAFFFVNIFKTSEEKITTWLSEHKDKVIALSPDGNINIKSSDVKKRNILIIGNEPHGIIEKIKSNFLTAAIEMASEIESINTSCAASIAMYEMWKK